MEKLQQMSERTIVQVHILQLLNAVRELQSILANNM
jgi:hypothetical protein